MSEKARIFVSLTALVTLTLAPAPTVHGTQEESRLRWHTYAGSSVDDNASGVAVDPSGNVYLTGWSDATWGSPILPHSGGRNHFVAKLKSTGELEWNTFLGPPGGFGETHIAVDGSGNVVVVGTSPGESPLFYGQHWGPFVAKLNSNGELQWRRLGAEKYWGDPTTVAVDALGSIYVGGWGGCFLAPNVHVGDGSWVGKLDSSGADVWTALVGCSFENGGPQAHTLVVDGSGNTHLTGRSTRSWGNPINPPAGGEDAFAVKLNSNGSLVWNTFMGSSSDDGGLGIAVDRSGNVYVSGSSEETWGTPIKGTRGGFVAKLDSSGVRQWNTFQGSMSWAVAVDEGQNIYVAGVGDPMGGFLLSLNRDGALQWSESLVWALEAMALGSRHVYVADGAGVSLGTPVNPYAGGLDAFVAKFEVNPPPADFHTVTPCRLLDSRIGPPGALQAGETRAITAVGKCEIPADAAALALNVTATQPTAAGNLRLYASGQPRPLVSTLNYSPGQTRANNAVAGVNAAGSLSVYCSQASGSVHFIVDVTGYYK